MTEDNPDRSALESLARDFLDERRRSRRWSIFFHLAALALAVIALLALVATIGIGQKVCLDRCTAVVHVDGEIDRTRHANAANVISGLQSAFEYPRVKGVVVVINSPGGSPVQAGQIHDEIRRLRGAHPDKPVHAVVEEMAASGGYYVAAAAERIYVDQASIVGSIGVIMESFGLEGAIGKLGIERRTITAGENKAFLDPFAPVDPKQREHVRGMLADVHRQFVKAVRDGRGARLKETPDLFSGLVWTGAQALELGLADELGSVEHVAREVIKAPEVVDFTPEENLASRVARRLGTAIAHEVRAALVLPRYSGYAVR
jgi:protease-4